MEEHNKMLSNDNNTNDKPVSNITKNTNYKGKTYDPSYTDNTNSRKNIKPDISIGTDPQYNQYNYSASSKKCGSRIIEDTIPINVCIGNRSIEERIIISSCIETIIVGTNSYGKDIVLNKSSVERNELAMSIQEIMKEISLGGNRFNFYASSPYDDIPFGTIILRMAYPIKYRFDNPQLSEMTENSTLVNSRVYALSYAEYFSFANDIELKYMYDVWRELFYYQYIKAKVVDTKQCPHFVIPHSYFFCEDELIEYFNIKSLLLQNSQKRRITAEFSLLLKNKFMSFGASLSLPIIQDKRKFYLPDEKNPQLQQYSETSLVIMTESPTYNFYDWCSVKYSNTECVSRMTGSGFRKLNDWYNIFFQIAIACNTLLKHRIFIRDMCVESNVFITDCGRDGHRIYKSDGFEFTVPNIGYNVLLDSSYLDIKDLDLVDENCVRKFKIHFGKESCSTYDPDNMLSYGLSDDKWLCREIMKNIERIMNPNIFNAHFINMGLRKPPDAIMEFLNSFNNTINARINSGRCEESISDIIAVYFSMYLHPSIGKEVGKEYITTFRNVTNNVEYVRNNIQMRLGYEFNNPVSLRVGEVAAEVIGYQKYKWCVIRKLIPSTSSVEIITTTDCETVLTKIVRIETIKQFPRNEYIRVAQKEFGNIQSRGFESQLIEVYNC